MMFAIGFLLFLAMSPCFSQSNSGSVKICVVDNDSDPSWLATIDSIALFIAKNHLKAPQIYSRQDKEMCEFVGAVDRAKLRADFILVVKKHNTTKFECDPEWGRQSFGILNFYPEQYKPIEKPHGKATFVAKLAFSSAESEVTQWINVTSTADIVTKLKEKFMSPQSRIPDEYPFKAEREERVKRRTLKAVIALMGLAVCSLLVIMFLGSLSRYNESKKLKEQELERKKKHEQQASSSQVPSKNYSDDKSEKVTDQSGKAKKSLKSNKDDEKEPLIDKSNKSSEKSSKKEV
ncbi:unnamed protein product [Caenorhabditis brenneri]